jgi:hypothetical protein
MDDAPQPMHGAEIGSAKAPAERDEEPECDQAPGQPPANNEIGGPKGPEPTRYGDWERKGRCIDF